MQKKFKNTKKNTDTLLVNSETGQPLQPLTSEQLTDITNFLVKEYRKRREIIALKILKEHLASKGIYPKNSKD